MLYMILYYIVLYSYFLYIILYHVMLNYVIWFDVILNIISYNTLHSHRTTVFHHLRRWWEPWHSPLELNPCFKTTQGCLFSCSSVFLGECLKQQVFRPWGNTEIWIPRRNVFHNLTLFFLKQTPNTENRQLTLQGTDISHLGKKTKQSSGKRIC